MQAPEEGPDFSRYKDLSGSWCRLLQTPQLHLPFPVLVPCYPPLSEDPNGCCGTTQQIRLNKTVSQDTQLAKDLPLLRGPEPQAGYYRSWVCVIATGFGA